MKNVFIFLVLFVLACSKKPEEPLVFGKVENVEKVVNKGPVKSSFRNIITYDDVQLTFVKAEIFHTVAWKKYRLNSSTFTNLGGQCSVLHYIVSNPSATKVLYWPGFYGENPMFFDEHDNQLALFNFRDYVNEDGSNIDDKGFRLDPGENRHGLICFAHPPKTSEKVIFRSAYKGIEFEISGFYGEIDHAIRRQGIENAYGKMFPFSDLVANKNNIGVGQVNYFVNKKNAYSGINENEFSIVFPKNSIIDIEGHVVFKEIMQNGSKITVTTKNPSFNHLVEDGGFCYFNKGMLDLSTIKNGQKINIIGNLFSFKIEDRNSLHVEITNCILK